MRKVLFMRPSKFALVFAIIGAIAVTGVTTTLAFSEHISTAIEVNTAGIGTGPQLQSEGGPGIPTAFYDEVTLIDGDRSDQLGPGKTLGSNTRTIRASADVPAGTAEFELIGTVSGNTIPSTTPPGGVTIRLTERYEILSCASGLNLGDPVQIRFRAALTGLVDLSGRPSGSSEVTYSSRLFGRQGFEIASMFILQFGGLVPPLNIAIDELVDVIVDVNIGDKGRIDTILRGTLNGSSVVADSPPVANSLNAQGTSQLGFAPGFEDICIQTLSGAPVLPGPTPVAVDDAYSVDENNTLTVLASQGVLVNDSDDGDTLSAVLATGPLNGSLNLNPDGSFTYIPDANFNGVDTFSYTAQDPLPADSNLATVTLTVNPAPAEADLETIPQAIVPALAESGPVVIVAGRAIIGILIADLETGQDVGAVIRGVASGVAQRLTLRTRQGDIVILTDENTRITTPSGTDRVLEMISEGLPVRVAALADRPLLGPDGTPTDEPATALKLTIIPAQATRKHLRVVVTEIQSGGMVQVVDAKGEAFSYTLPTGMERGDNVVLLVQRGPEGEEQVKAQVNAESVQVRLERMLQAADEVSFTAPGTMLGLTGLLRQHQVAEENRLEQTLDKAPEDLKELIQETMEAVRAGSTVSLNTEPIPHPIPILNIVSPAEGEAVIQGTTITLMAEATGDDLELEFIVGGVVLGVATSEDSDGSYIQPYRVPPEITSFELEVKATDPSGQTVSASRTVRVTADPPPTVSIISPGEGELIAAISMTIIVRADDNNEVTSVVEGTLTANGETTGLVFALEDDATIPALGAVQPLPGMDWRVVVDVPSEATSLTIEVTATDNVGNTASATGTFEVSLPAVIAAGQPQVPHKFYGTATMADGSVAPDGTVVAALVGGKEVATAIVESSFQAGFYVLDVTPAPGETFVGLVVTFTVDGMASNQSAAWQSLKTQELNLTFLGVPPSAPAG